MSINIRVTEAAKKIGENYENKKAYNEAKDNYFTILEEELTKDPVNTWLDWEDPTICLEESMDNGDEKAWVSEVLDDYLRFCVIVEKVTSKGVGDLDLIARALKYIK